MLPREKFYWPTGELVKSPEMETLEDKLKDLKIMAQKVKAK